MMVDARILTGEIFPTYASAIKKYHVDRLRVHHYRPPSLKIQKPCCNLEEDMVQEQVPMTTYLEIEFKLVQFTDGEGDYWWRYVMA